jgi:hypothetical protein
MNGNDDAPQASVVTHYQSPMMVRKTKPLVQIFFEEANLIDYLHWIRK